MRQIEDLPTLYIGKAEIAAGSALYEQLKFLWRSAHEAASGTLSLLASKQFQGLVDKHGIELPEYIRLKLCPWCCAIQIQGVTQRTRVRSRGKGSGVNRNLRSICRIGEGADKVSVKVKNGVVNTCTVCSRKISHSKAKPTSKGIGSKALGLEEERGTKNVQSYLGCKRMQRTKVIEEASMTEANMKKKEAKISHSSSTGSLVSAGSGSGNASVYAGASKFSFMNKVVTSSAPGRITPFSGLGSAMMVTANSANPSPGPVSLLDLEAAHKKKKKKRK